MNMYTKPEYRRNGIAYKTLDMLIKDMFRKPIDRNIQGVIVVGEDGLNDEKNELEEYVVTRELQRHFKEFYENYKQGIIGKTRKNWCLDFRLFSAVVNRTF